MARFRIVQRPSCIDPTKACFSVEERKWFQWEERAWSWDLEEAEKMIARTQEQRRDTVATKVIKEYNF